MAKIYEQDDKIFKTAADLKFYLEIKHRQEINDIQTYNVDSLLVNRPSNAKYKAKKVIIDDNVFDSKLEVKYYFHLLDLIKEKEILGFDLNPKFELLPGFNKNGKRYQAITYVADFKVYHLDGTVEIVDTKGVITPVFAMKQKMFESKYPNLSIKVLIYKPTYGGWIEHDDYETEKRKRKKAKKKSTK